MSSTNEGKSIMVQGRIVWVAGNLFQGKPKVDQQTKQPIIDQKTGRQKVEYGFGLAVPKNLCNDIWAVMHEMAYTIYPSRQLPPGFAMKYKDGDAIDHRGQSFNQREGYAGHLVFSCTTSIPIKFFKYDNGQNFQINEGIKCGDYVNVQLNIKAHPSTGGNSKPGLYLNPNAVQFLGFGEEIINSPSGDDIFGNSAPVMPAGASATPIAPPGMLVPPGQQQAYPPPQQPSYQQPAPAAPQAPAQPHYGVLPQIHQPQQQAPVPQMVPPPQYGAPQGFPQQPVPAAPASNQYGQPMTQQQPAGFAPPAFPSSMPGQPVPGGMPPLPQFGR